MQTKQIFFLFVRKVGLKNFLFFATDSEDKNLFDHFADSVRDRAKQMFTKDRKWILRKNNTFLKKFVIKKEKV